jgi:hypothetical protein
MFLVKQPIKEIHIQVIPHDSQRYETLGDYFRDENGTLQIRVSQMSKNEYEMLIMIHEIVEVMLTEHRGIPEPEITAFDIEFEKNRTNTIDEPGDDPQAPYCSEHCTATGIERILCAELKENWKNYEEGCRN